ncbi:MFS transporter [Paenibacillus sp. UNC451MF]|uniref:MFS transporter n=1 Tax=Paenibacillus sp. UNC451MF TaxID=1449063 RepID=UPI000491E7B0|nr:MFS transporter [Paenibacillus sp. UNC451MF]
MNTNMEYSTAVDTRPTNQVRKIGIKDKTGYMFGDIGTDLFFGLISGYLMLFYTDVYGISAAAAGMILLVARVLDALFDVAWGLMLTRSLPARKGSFVRIYCIVHYQ